MWVHILASPQGRGVSKADGEGAGIATITISYNAMWAHKHNYALCISRSDKGVFLMVEEIKAKQITEEDIFVRRQSIDLTTANATFTRSEGGLISLELKGENGETEKFERIVPIRAFPITDPGAFISIREPDTREGGKGAEIGMIGKLSDFPEEIEKLILEELERRYFTPAIEKIYNVKEKFGYLYFDVLTSSGKVSFVMNNPSSNIRMLEDRRFLLYDIDGNCFEIPEVGKMDKASFKKIEIYL